MVFNKLEILSNDKKMMEGIKGFFDGDFSLDKIISAPKTLKGIELRNWCDENWGTSRECITEEYELYQNGSNYCLEIVFCTAHTSSVKVIKKLSEMFPNVSMLLDVSYEIDGSPEEIYFDGGKITLHRRFKRKWISIKNQDTLYATYEEALQHYPKEEIVDRVDYEDWEDVT